ncbi:cell wall-binding repeat-containing protein [Agrococcus citreus]|uniref:cell wall-binding repeat-containing protein n=1 Tax=Agrococcus citreus TaxID=84643 RepID=UPI0031D9D2DE
MLDRSTSHSPSHPRRGRAVAGAVLAVAVLASALAAAPPAADAMAALPATERLAAPDRYQTAARVSEHVFPDGADIAYLVTGEGFVDGIMAGPAAAEEGGPVLLTPGASLAPATAAEIQRLDPSTVVIVGSWPSVSIAAEDAVRELDPTREVVRVQGGGRFDTNSFLWQRVYPDAETSAAFLTNAFRFPDGLAGGPAAALLDAPMLLSDGGRIEPPSMPWDALQHIDPDYVALLGGEDALGNGTFLGIPPGAEVERFAGADRFETAALLTALFPPVDTVYIASGETYADALAGAAAAGAEGVPMLLARRDCMPGATLDALLELRPDRVILLGGEPTLGQATAAYARCG